LASRSLPRSPSCHGWYGGCGAKRRPGIEVNELASRIEGSSGIVVIDVRGPDEFAGPLGHIAGAKNLPVGELALRLHELTAWKDRSVVLVYQTDKRSAIAAALLRDSGFPDVRVLRGGIEQWNASGLPVEGRVPSD
jgi:rhodanese-related sulfurtransferase